MADAANILRIYGEHPDQYSSVVYLFLDPNGDNNNSSAFISPEALIRHLQETTLTWYHGDDDVHDNVVAIQHFDAAITAEYLRALPIPSTVESTPYAMSLYICKIQTEWAGVKSLIRTVFDVMRSRIPGVDVPQRLRANIRYNMDLLAAIPRATTDENADPEIFDVEIPFRG